MAPKEKTTPSIETHEEAEKSFRFWTDATLEHRERQLRDLQYYHHKQWTSSELRALKARNQPATTYNHIHKKLNYLLGQEIRSRVDPKVRPRTPAHESEVDALTDALRFVSDAENVNYKFSCCYFDFLVPGTCGAIIEPESTGDDTLIKVRPIRWSRLWWDHHSTAEDFSDAAFVGAFSWWDLSDAVKFFSGKPGLVENFEDVLEQTRRSADDSDPSSDRPTEWWDPARKRVRVVDKYWKDGDNWYVRQFTGGGDIIEPMKTGLFDEDGNCVRPLVMQSAFVDDEGERYGVVRPMISPQDEINFRHSKSLHLLSVRQIVIGKGAGVDRESLRREAAKADGVIEVEDREQFEMVTNAQLAQGHVELMRDAKMEIDSIGPNIHPGADSTGRSIQLSQDIGSIELAPIKDRFSNFRKNVFSQAYLRVRQFWTHEKWLDVTDDAESSGYRFVRINEVTTRIRRFQEAMAAGIELPGALTAAYLDPQAVMQAVTQQIQQESQMTGLQIPQDPQAQKQLVIQTLMTMPQMQAPIIANEIANLNADIILDEVPDTSIVQHEELRELRELAQSLISSGQQVPPQFLTMFIEASSLRNKKKLLAMLEPKEDPQAAQLQQTMQQMQQQMMQLQMALTQAKIAETQADAQLKQARTAVAVQEAGVAPEKVIAEAVHDRAIAEKHLADAEAKRAQARGTDANTRNSLIGLASFR